MDKQKFYVNIFMSVFIGILFFVSLGFLIYCIAVQNKIYYILLVSTVVMSFLTSFFITQAVKYHRESRKDTTSNSES